MQHQHQQYFVGGPEGQFYQHYQPQSQQIIHEQHPAYYQQMAMPQI